MRKMPSRVGAPKAHGRSDQDAPTPTQRRAYARDDGGRNGEQRALADGYDDRRRDILVVVVATAAATATAFVVNNRASRQRQRLRENTAEQRRRRRSNDC